MADTIFALSSGAPPAAIAVVRISGRAAGPALAALAGRLPRPRRAVAALLHDAAGRPLDHALILWLPGPGSATGEDCAELHLHGGRAIVAAVEAALGALPDLRRAEPGEFTRRAFTNGKIDLAEAEGLADLLAAETEAQRLSAMAMAGGRLSGQVENWRTTLLGISAQVEAALDFSDEADVGDPCSTWNVAHLIDELQTWLERPRAEALRDGIRVVLAGPPNAGKSTLFNALIEAEGAIVSPQAGTTRDLITRTVAIGGMPFLFVDTAGLRPDDTAEDAIERIGMDRARAELDRADIVLWLGPDETCPPQAWNIAAQCDRPNPHPKVSPRHRISALTGEGLNSLRADLIAAASGLLPRPGEASLNARQHRLIAQAAEALGLAATQTNPLLVAEGLRLARHRFDELVGRAATEDMLDALFGRFCIGK